MKTINISKSLFILIVAVISLTSCKKDLEFSKPTFWPNIEIKGLEYVVVNVGDDYEDESADVTVDGNPIDFTTVSTVNSEETGVYTVTYTAENEDGISASKQRTVVVVNPDAALDDLSGVYARGAAVSTWKKDESHPYRYIANNPGGVPGNPPFDVPFYVYNVEPGIVVVPLQQSGALAPFYSVNSDGSGSNKIPFNLSAAPGDVAYQWIMIGANFGTAVRIFKKV